MSTPSERRGGTRLPVTLDARWHGPSGHHQGRVTNLSQGGCFVATPHGPAEGERIVMVIDLSAVASLTTEARVAHHGANGFGAEFIGLRDEPRRILDEAWARLLQSTRR